MRSARLVFAWIPAYAGTTMYCESRHTQAHGSCDDVIPTSIALQRKPESRPMRAVHAASLPLGVGEQYRCSPPSEPYGRFSRIRLSGQWLSTSRLALKSVS